MIEIRSAGILGADPMIIRVWIEPGCIVCKLCEETAPAVFHVTETDCVVKEGADLSDAERIKHAAYECPVTVIKYEESNG